MNEPLSSLTSHYHGGYDIIEIYGRDAFEILVYHGPIYLILS